MFSNATPEMILTAYRQGIFPMAEDKNAPYYDFYRPEMRGQLSISNIHIPKKLLKKIRQKPYEIKINTDFLGVINACAESYKGRESTWINKIIRDVFIELNEQSHAHSVECWQNNNLVGGLYGLTIGGVFCGESMFSKATDASKISLIHLCARLQKGGFTVLDTQFTNPHLDQFNIYEIPQEDYESLIKTEMEKSCDFLLSDINEDTILEEYLSQK